MRTLRRLWPFCRNAGRGNRKRIESRVQGCRKVGRLSSDHRKAEGKDPDMKLAMHIIAPIAAIGLLALCFFSQVPVIERIR